MRAQAIDFLANVGASRDQHGFLVQTVGGEGGVGVDKLGNLGLKAGLDRVRLARGSSLSFADKALDGGELLVQHGRERLTLRQASGLQRFDEAIEADAEGFMKGRIVTLPRRLVL